MVEGLQKWIASRTRRDWVLLACFGMLAGAALVAVAWTQREWLLEAVGEGRVWLLETLQVVPLWLYLVMFVVLPAVGAPLTLFYLTVGAMVEGVGWALVVAWSCVLGNMALSYFLGRSLLHGFLEKLLRARGWRIPQVSRSMEWKLILMLRSSPAPWLIQNYLLALAGTRFGRYLGLSILVQGPIGAGVIVVGDSLFKGQAKFALIGIFLFFVASFGLSILRRKTSKAAGNELGEGEAEGSS